MPYKPNAIPNAPNRVERNKKTDETQNKSEKNGKCLCECVCCVVG